MADRLEVVAPRLLVADVRVDTRVPGSPRQVLTFSEGDVLTVGVLVALGQPEVYDLDVVLACIVAADQEIVGFDISVNNALLMHFLNALNLYNHI